MTEPKVPNAEVGEIVAMLYGPKMEADHGMAFAEVSAYVGEHGHLPPLTHGPAAGLLPCGPFHMECDHTCQEHAL